MLSELPGGELPDEEMERLRGRKAPLPPGILRGDASPAKSLSAPSPRVQQRTPVKKHAPQDGGSDPTDNSGFGIKADLSVGSRATAAAAVTGISSPLSNLGIGSPPQQRNLAFDGLSSPAPLPSAIGGSPQSDHKPAPVVAHPDRPAGVSTPSASSHGSPAGVHPSSHQNSIQVSPPDTSSMRGIGSPSPQSSPARTSQPDHGGRPLGEYNSSPTKIVTNVNVKGVGEGLEAKERDEKEARDKQEREVAERLEKETKKRQEQEAKDQQEREAKEKQEREAKEKLEREAREQRLLAAKVERDRLEREERERAEEEQRLLEQLKTTAGGLPDDDDDDGALEHAASMFSMVRGAQQPVGVAEKVALADQQALPGLSHPSAPHDLPQVSRALADESDDDDSSSPSPSHHSLSLSPPRPPGEVMGFDEGGSSPDYYASASLPGTTANINMRDSMDSEAMVAQMMRGEAAWLGMNHIRPNDAGIEQNSQQQSNTLSGINSVIEDDDVF